MYFGDGIDLRRSREQENLIEKRGGAQNQDQVSAKTGLLAYTWLAVGRILIQTNLRLRAKLLLHRTLQSDSQKHYAIFGRTKWGIFKSCPRFRNLAWGPK